MVTGSLVYWLVRPRVLVLGVVFGFDVALCCAYCKLAIAASGVFDLVKRWVAWFWCGGWVLWLV